MSYINNKIVVVSGVSGKETTKLLSELLLIEAFNLCVPLSTTSRKPRIGEENGVDYYFISPQQFEKQIEQGDFIEYQHVYGDIYYGTSKYVIEGTYNNSIIETDPANALAIKKTCGDDALTIFLKPSNLQKFLDSQINNRRMENHDDYVSILNAIELANDFDCIALYKQDSGEIETEEIIHRISEFLRCQTSYYLNESISGTEILQQILSLVEKKYHLGNDRIIYRGITSFHSAPFKDIKAIEHCILSGSDVRFSHQDNPINVNPSYLSDLVCEAKRMFPGKYNGSELEILAEIQHYGGATCLIDFSKNILISLWFACCGEHNKTGYLYCYNIENDVKNKVTRIVDNSSDVSLKDTILRNVTDNPRFYIWEPVALNSRIIRQDSIFLFGKDPFLVKEHDVLTIRIPSKLKPIILEFISDMFNISEKTVFRDPVGFAIANGKLKPFTKQKFLYQ